MKWHLQKQHLPAGGGYYQDSQVADLFAELERVSLQLGRQEKNTRRHKRRGKFFTQAKSLAQA